jgi:hypothetical protein
LKPEYYAQARKNIDRAIATRTEHEQSSLF